MLWLVKEKLRLLERYKAKSHYVDVCPQVNFQWEQYKSWP